MCAPCPCGRDKDACGSVIVEKPNRVCHFGSSVSHQGAADAKTLTFPCASAPRAEPELLSNLREEIQTYTEGQEKRENPAFSRGLLLAEGPMRCSYQMLSLKSNLSNIFT